MKFPKFKVSLKKQENIRPADPIPLPEPKAPEVSGIYDAVVLSQAKNPQWIYVRINGMDGKFSLIIPVKPRGIMTGNFPSIPLILT